MRLAGSVEAAILAAPLNRVAQVSLHGIVAAFLALPPAARMKMFGNRLAFRTLNLTRTGHRAPRRKAVYHERVMEVRTITSPSRRPPTLIVSDPLLHPSILVTFPNNSGAHLFAVIRNSE
jgi:hypothetical protein